MTFERRLTTKISCRAGCNDVISQKGRDAGPVNFIGLLGAARRRVGAPAGAAEGHAEPESHRDPYAEAYGNVPQGCPKGGTYAYPQRRAECDAERKAVLPLAAAALTTWTCCHSASPLPFVRRTNCDLSGFKDEGG